MKNTTATRGSDGRFGGSDGPKAKPVQVWLRPDTLAALDELCSQWGVGRGKVIDQLVTRGPVAPKIWEKVESKAAPTNTDRVQSATEGLLELERRHARLEALGKAEAKRIGISYSDLIWATRELDIKRDYPLGADAEQAVKEKVERSQRMDNGRGIAQAARRDFIKKLDSKTINQLYKLVSEVEVDSRQVARYLMDGYNNLGLKPYRKICPGFWKQLDELNSAIPQNPLLWGIVVRLSDLGDIPTNSDRLLDWCQFSVHVNHAKRQDQRLFNDVWSALNNSITESDARRVLGIPLEMPLTKQGIKDAYKPLARKHHPDIGGDPAKCQEINEARDRLLLTVKE